MREVITNWQPKNEITTPLIGTPVYVNSGIIKAVMNSGEKISIAQIDYQEFDEENFQYVISPYWEIVDALPSQIFQGIPGIDMELRLNHYYRVNYIPTFIVERTPSKNREDLWELLEEVDLDYYDRFEWLLRTKKRCANDNLIVEKRRPVAISKEMDEEIIASLQYGDKLIVNSLEDIAKTPASFQDSIFDIVTNGIDVISYSGEKLINVNTRMEIAPIVVTHRMMIKQDYIKKRNYGINEAKKKGKYNGRKPAEVDEKILREVSFEVKNGLISIEEALRRTNLKSKSTFYRKVRALKDNN